MRMLEKEKGMRMLEKEKDRRGSLKCWISITNIPVHGARNGGGSKENTRRKPHIPPRAGVKQDIFDGLTIGIIEQILGFIMRLG